MTFPRRVAPRVAGGSNSIQGVIALGVGEVTTVTRAVGVIPTNCIVSGVRIYGQAATTATALTVDVLARTAAGATGATILSAAVNIDTTAALLQAGITASLTATPANLKLAEGRLVVATVTADTCSAGPGDLVVEIEYAPVG